MAIIRDIAYAIGGLLTSPVWGIAMLRTGKWRTDWRGRFGHVRGNGDGKEGGGASVVAASSGSAKSNAVGAMKTVLIHAVSVGEVNATRAMVQQLSDRLASLPGGGRIVISATTNTGFARAVELFGNNHTVVRYPLDFTGSVRRFLTGIRPDVVALMELEVWPTFVGECARRDIPVCVVNGRLSERSYKRYRWIRPLIRGSFARLAAAAVQTIDYAKRFIAMGAIEERVTVTDSMKWDTSQVAEPESIRGVSELALAMGIDRSRPVIVAGSTGPGEEEMLIRTKPKGAQLVLVPRKPERFEEVAALIKATAPPGPGPYARAKPQAKVVRRSERPDGTTRFTDDNELFLIDTMGELRKAYALADVAIVGRSFIDLFGSDPIESIALGKPTIIGPRYGDFQDIVDTFRSEDGIVVSDAPCEAASGLLANRERARELAVNGRRVILSRQGATARHVELIMRLLSEKNMKSGKQENMK